MANKPYNPFENGVEMYQIDQSSFTLRVVGEQDDFVIYATRDDGRRFVLNIVNGDDRYDEPKADN